MAKIKNWTKVGQTGNYQYESEVKPTQRMTCGATGISSTFGALSDEEIEKMIAKKNEGFRKMPAPVVTAGKPGV